MPIIANVQLSAVEPATAKNGKTYWRLKYGDDKSITVFEYDEAEAAKRFIGEFVDIETKQDGKYENFVSISPTAGTSPAQPATEGFNRRTNPIDASRMCKCASLETAFAFVGAFQGNEEAVKAALPLAVTIAKGIYEAIMGVDLEKKPAETPAEVAEQVNEAVGAPAVHTGIDW